SRLRNQGFDTFFLMVNYKAEMISSYFSSGSSFGVRIEYFEEQTKRGTAGPLSSLREHVDEPFVVMNADVLTSLDFKKLMDYHKTMKSDLTLALKSFKRKIAYGVIDLSPDSVITGIREKPTLSFLINSGIYVVSPETLRLIPDEGVFQMTELIEAAKDDGLNVIGYEFSEPWRDIGRIDDYMKTISDLESGEESDADGVFI
ncbi:MAG: sugar phosphate nucleotidyltransferase, partial [Candidatus Thorarchaeota archaeon]